MDFLFDSKYSGLTPEWRRYSRTFCDDIIAARLTELMLGTPADEHGYRPEISRDASGIRIGRLGWYSEDTRVDIVARADAVYTATLLRHRSDLAQAGEHDGDSVA